MSSVFKTYFPMCRICITWSDTLNTGSDTLNTGLIPLTLEQMHDSQYKTPKQKKCSVKFITFSVLSSYIRSWREYFLKEIQIVLFLKKEKCHSIVRFGVAMLLHYIKCHFCSSKNNLSFPSLFFFFFLRNNVSVA